MKQHPPPAPSRDPRYTIERVSCEHCQGSGRSKRRAESGTAAAVRHGRFAYCRPCDGAGYFDLRRRLVQEAAL